MNDHRLGTRNPYAGPGSPRSPKYPQEARMPEGGDHSRNGNQRNGNHKHNGNAEHTRVTRNHDTIREWAEQRGARPATTPGSEYNGRLGVLRFDFPGYGGAVLRPVDWDEWFATFDARRLQLRYLDRLPDGSPSNFNRLERPNREER
ncbi:hypothetical protein [Nocardia sp. NPDC049149]|uniref:hypothetical protein n=1 Tax=Nocardia sp. NPDC049149 TaxID=3364315 RepID=UPI00371E51E6